MNSKIKYIFGAAAALICFVIYLLTLYPGVGFMDTGELAAACYTFGIPHPTGYPLFLVIGYIFSHLPLPGSIIYKLNLLSAIESAIAVFITYLTAVNLSSYLIGKIIKQAPSKVKDGKQKSKGAVKNVNENSEISSKPTANDASFLAYILGFSSAIACGLTSTFWQDAIQVEVYALHSLFLSLIMYYVVKIFTGDSYNKKHWIGLFIFIGLSFSNHLTTLFILPSVLNLIYLTNKNGRGSYKNILPLIIYALPGLLMYVILVIASGNEPYLNWSDLQNISNLWRHLSGSDYSNLMFSGSARFSINAGDFFKQLPGEFAWLSLILALLGFIAYWKYLKEFVIFSLIAVIFTLLYAFNYNIVDINTYYLLAYYMLALAVPGGLLLLLSFGNPFKLFNSAPSLKPAITKTAAAAVIILAVSAGFNFKSNDNSSNYANADLTVNTLNSLPQNSVLICYDWAYLYSASLYYQLAEKMRPDVKVFNVKFLTAGWYLNMIKKFHPEIYSLIQKEADDYIRVISAEPKQKAPQLSALVAAIINNTAGKFPLFISVDLILEKEMKPYLSNLRLVPVGTVYRVEPPNAAYDVNAGVNTLGNTYRKFEPDNKQKNLVFRTVPGMYYETAYYHYNNKNFELSLKFLNKALEIDPKFNDAIKLKSMLPKQQ